MAISSVGKRDKVYREKKFYSSDVWTVPKGVHQVDVTVVGAGTASGSSAGGSGGVIRKTVQVSPGESINIGVANKPITTSTTSENSFFGDYLVAGSGKLNFNISSVYYGGVSGATLDTQGPITGYLFDKGFTRTGTPNSSLYIASNDDYVLAKSGTTVYRSANGVDFTSVGTLASNYGTGTRSLEYGNGMWIATNTGHASDYYTSVDDGATWTQRTVPAHLSTASYVEYVHDRWFMYRTNLADKVAWSSDGISWNAVTFPSSTGLFYGQAYYHDGLWGIFNIVNNSSVSCIKSTNGTTWSLQSSIFSGTTSMSYRGGVVDNLLFIGSDTTINYSSNYVLPALRNNSGTWQLIYSGKYSTQTTNIYSHSIPAYWNSYASTGYSRLMVHMINGLPLLRSYAGFFRNSFYYGDSFDSLPSAYLKGRIYFYGSSNDSYNNSMCLAGDLNFGFIGSSGPAGPIVGGGAGGPANPQQTSSTTSVNVFNAGTLAPGSEGYGLVDLGGSGSRPGSSMNGGVVVVRWYE